MARITGRLTNIGLGKESTRGTAVAPTYWLPKLELNFDDKNEKKLNESSYGVIEKNAGAAVTKEWGEGDLKGIIYSSSFGLVLTNVMGAAPTTTTVETTAKKHTFAVAQTATHQSLTVGVKDSNLDLKFALGMISSLKLDYQVSDFLNFTASFLSKKSATATQTVTYAATDTPFIPKNVVFKTAAVGSTNLTAASAQTDIIALTLEINKNAEATQALGSTDLENVNNKSFEVKGTIEKYYNDGSTYKDLYTANTHKSMRIDAIDTATTVGAVTNPSLRFDLEDVVFTAWEKGMGNDDIETEKIEFVALWNLTATKMLSVELVNGVASY